LVGLGLLASDDSKFANTAAATRYLTTDSPQRLTGYINYSSGVMWPMWGNLPDAIRQGTHRWQQTYGWDGPIFASFFKTDEAMREFLMGMHGFGMLTSPAIVGAVDLSRFRQLVDLGGATGHFAIAACHRYSELRATVFDLPMAVGLAKEITAASGVSDRIEVVGGDFFVDPLPAGDLYSLGRIVHDWSQDKIRLLLAKIFAALPPGGGVVIAEKILADSKDGPPWAQLQDINMLIVTEGRERTLAQYETLLMEAGFGDVVACRTATPLDIILATKPPGSVE
jgi:acetylserotonin O-methyltransferase